MVTLQNGGRDWSISGPSLLGEQIMSLARDGSGQTLYVGTHKGGVFQSTDQGKSWQPKSEGLTFKDVRSLAVHPQDSKVVFAGTSPAAMFVTRDSGEHWAKVPSVRNHATAKNWSFPVEPRIPHLRTIAFDPVTPEIMYAGVEVGTLLKSEDWGRTWADIGATISKDVHYVAIHPSKPERVFVASADDTPPFDCRAGHGMYRSNDRGKSWKHIISGLGKRTFCHDATAFDPKDPNTLYISAGDGVPPYWSNNGMFVPERRAAVLTGETAYFMWPSRLKRPTGCDTVIFRTRNAGESWEPIMKGLPESLFSAVWALDVSCPPGGGACQIFFGTTSGEVYWSRDGGESWGEIMNNLPGITHMKAL
jgi:photosystem II stability/assembly factor-like uncharacterized protein